MFYKILGGLLIAFGVLDLFMANTLKIDIWAEWLGIDLYSISELLYTYLAWAIVVVGACLWTLSEPDEGTPEIRK